MKRKTTNIDIEESFDPPKSSNEFNERNEFLSRFMEKIPQQVENEIKEQITKLNAIKNGNITLEDAYDIIYQIAVQHSNCKYRKIKN